ncbi:immunity 49 family protein [Myxococcaceae bacterium JPH2]|nr:immunity 49 family protein [Myxococcaceae bacterium JPH2]
MLTVQHHEENALYALQLLEAHLDQGQRPAEEREQFLFHMSRHGRIAAISGLLVRMDVPAFHDRLRRSGTYRLRLLRERQAEGRPFNHFTGTGQIAPLCDALAAGDDALAKEIAALSAPSWVRRKEFEDDCHYGRILGLLASDGSPIPSDAELLLADLVRSTGEDSAPRVRICRALLVQEPEAFHGALQALVEEHGAHFRSRAGSLEASQAYFQTERAIFVEGLALLRLAMRRGLAVEEREYAFLPSPAWAR